MPNKRVLISMLGKGESFSRDIPGYRKAKYKFADGYEKETSYFSDVLLEYLYSIETPIDELIVIGTNDSDWENFLYYFANKCGESLDLNEFATKLEQLQGNISETALIKFKNIFGAVEFTPVVIPFGINVNEIKEILGRIINLDIDPNADLYIDITHGFRSIPFMVSYFTSYISLKYPEVKIKDIFYGMLEVSRDKGYAPVVSLKYLTEFDNWRHASEVFLKTGHASGLVKLMEATPAENFQRITELFSSFNDNYGLGYFNSTSSTAKRLYSKLDAQKKDSDIPQEFEYLRTIYMEFIGKFKNRSIPSQFNLAKDYATRGLFANAFLLLNEALLSYAVDEIKGAGEYKKEKARKDIAKKLKKEIDTKTKMGKQFIKLYTDIKLDVRNNIAHCGMESEDKVEYNPQKKFYKYFERATEIMSVKKHKPPKKK